MPTADRLGASIAKIVYDSQNSILAPSSKANFYLAEHPISLPQRAASRRKMSSTSPRGFMERSDVLLISISMTGETVETMQPGTGNWDMDPALSY